MSDRRPDSSSQPTWIADVEPFLAGDLEARDRLARGLAQQALTAASVLLGAENPDIEDVAQDSTLAVLENIRRREGFEGDLISFTVTVARNRCRSLLAYQRVRPQARLEPLIEWIAHPDRSPLDALLDAEVTRTLQEAIDALDESCRKLLHAFYFEDVPMEEIRRLEGLGSVQGIYYRRGICLEQVERFLKRRLFGRSRNGTEYRGA